MPRRANLPGADLLFGAPAQTNPRTEESAPEPAAPTPASGRRPVTPADEAPTSSTDGWSDRAPAEGVAGRSAARLKRAEAPSGPSGRPRHEEKITFYCTDAELTRLEAARLSLRANHRMASDRGRIIRAAIEELLDDFDARGAESVLVKRLSPE